MVTEYGVGFLGVKRENSEGSHHNKHHRAFSLQTGPFMYLSWAIVQPTTTKEPAYSLTHDSDVSFRWTWTGLSQMMRDRVGDACRWCITQGGTSGCPIIMMIPRVKEEENGGFRARGCLSNARQYGSHVFLTRNQGRGPAPTTTSLVMTPTRGRVNSW